MRRYKALTPGGIPIHDSFSEVEQKILALSKAEITPEIRQFTSFEEMKKAKHQAYSEMSVEDRFILAEYLRRIHFRQQYLDYEEEDWSQPKEVLVKER